MPDYAKGSVSCCKSTWDRDNGLQHASDCPLGKAWEAMRGETVIMVHVLEAGRAVCGYGSNYSNPGAWPDEHRWCHREDFSREQIEAINEERKQGLREHRDQGVYCFTPYVPCEKCAESLAKRVGSNVKPGKETTMADPGREALLAALATLDERQLSYVAVAACESISDDWYSEDADEDEKSLARIVDVIGPFIGYTNDVQGEHAALVRQFVRDIWAVSGSPQKKRESIKEVIASLKRTLQSSVGLGGD